MKENQTDLAHRSWFPWLKGGELSRKGIHFTVLRFELLKYGVLMWVYPAMLCSLLRGLGKGSWLEGWSHMETGVSSLPTALD